MAGNSKRDIVTLESTAGTGYRYSVTKNKRLQPYDSPENAQTAREKDPQQFVPPEEAPAGTEVGDDDGEDASCLEGGNE